MGQLIERRPQHTISRLDDETLIERVRNGDDAALGELYRRHAPAATRAARSFTGSAHDADDVVSDVFSSIWSAIRNGRGPTDRFEPYLIAAVRNRSRSAWTNGPETSSAAHTSIAGLDRDPVEPDVGSFAGRAFRRLTEREREMLWLTAVEGHTSSEAGQEMALTRRAAATLRFRAKRAFAEAYLSEFAAAAGRPECHKLARKLSSYVRGSCRSRARRAVESHLHLCATCRRLADELADVNSMLRSFSLPAAAAALAARSARRGWRGDVAIQIRRGAASQAWLKPAAYVATAGTVVLMPGAALFGPDRGVPDPQVVVIEGSRPPTEHDVDGAAPEPPPPPSADPGVDALSVGEGGGASGWAPSAPGAPSIEVLDAAAVAATSATTAPRPVDVPVTTPPTTVSSEPAPSALPTSASDPAPVKTTQAPTSPITPPPTAPAPTALDVPSTAVPRIEAEIEVSADVESGAQVAIGVDGEVSDEEATLEATVAATVPAIDATVDAVAAITANEESLAVDIGATLPAVTVAGVTLIPQLMPEVELDLPLGG